jgi:hypothetical protein
LAKELAMFEVFYHL